MSREIVRSLRGVDLNILSESELEFLDLLNSEIETIVLIRQTSNDFNNEAFDDLVATLQNSLQGIINNLRLGRTSRKKFCSEYPKWKKCREDSVRHLLEIAKSIDDDRFNCNVSKLVGYSTSLAGGLLCLGSALAIPFTLGATTPLAIAGGSMTAAGVCTSFGTSCTETALLNNKVKKAQEILKKDEKYFDKLSDWLKHAEDLQEALNTIMKIDIAREISKPVKEMVGRALGMANQFERLQYVKQVLNTIFGATAITALEVPPIAVGVLLLVLAAIYMLINHGDNRLIFDFSALTVRSIIGILSLLDDTMDCVRLSALFGRAAGGNAVKAASLAKAVTRGAVAVVGIALDVAGIVLTSVDVQNGSRSPHAKKIFGVIDKMTDEAARFEELHTVLSG